MAEKAGRSRWSPEDEAEVLDLPEAEVPSQQDVPKVRLAFLDAVLDAYMEDDPHMEAPPAYGAGNAFDFADLDMKEATDGEHAGVFSDEDDDLDLFEAMRFPSAGGLSNQCEGSAMSEEETEKHVMPEFGEGNIFDFEGLDIDNTEEASAEGRSSPPMTPPSHGQQNVFDFVALEEREAGAEAEVAQEKADAEKTSFDYVQPSFGAANAFDFEQLEEEEEEEVVSQLDGDPLGATQLSPTENMAEAEAAAEQQGAAAEQQDEDGQQMAEEVLPAPEEVPEACRAVGIRLEELENPVEALALLKEFKRLEACSLPDLVFEYERRGFAADDEDPREELLQKAKEVVLATCLSLPHLVHLCRERGCRMGDFSRDGLEPSREELLRLLRYESWRAVGIALDQLPSLEAAQEILSHVRRLRTQTLDTLSVMCKERGIPTKGQLRRNLEDQMRQMLVWEQMPLHHLKSECRARSITAEVAQPASSRKGLVRRQFPEDSTVLIQRLTKSLWFGTWEAHGVPVRQLSTPEVAEEVYHEVVRLEGLSTSELEREFRKLNVPLLPGIRPGALLAFLKDAGIWKHFSTSELRKECPRLGVTRPVLSLAWEDVYRCLLEERCLRLWEMSGLDAVRLLGSFQSAAGLVAEIEHSEGLGTVELRGQYEEIGLPKARGTEISVIRKRLRKVFTWWALPLDALREECEKQGIATKVFGVAAAKEEDVKPRLVQQLIARECFKPEELEGIPVHKLDGVQAVHQIIEELKPYKTMGIAELKSACTEFGVPPEQGMDRRPELLSRLRSVLVWRWLPLEELRQECLSRGLQAEDTSRNKDELARRNELLQRLLSHLAANACNLSGLPVERLGVGPAAFVAQEFAKLDGMSDDQLREQHKEWGLPSPVYLTKQELLQRLKEATIWWNLPRDELISECKKRTISTDGLRRSFDEEAQREYLIDLLLFNSNLHQYEAQGIPAKQLQSWKACATLIAEWAYIESENNADLVKRYQELGLPSKGLGRTEIVRRMRQVALWLQLPLAMVQKECRAKHVNSIATEESKAELVIGLCHAHWASWDAEPEPQPGPSAFGGAGFGAFGSSGGAPGGSGPRGRAGISTTPPGLGKHFAALELSASAGLEDVKKAYRKLALKHHPDKNQGASQETSAQEFRRVSDAYQALTKHFEGG